MTERKSGILKSFVISGGKVTLERKKGKLYVHVDVWKWSKQTVMDLQMLSLALRDVEMYGIVPVSDRRALRVVRILGAKLIKYSFNETGEPVIIYSHDSIA